MWIPVYSNVEPEQESQKDRARKPLPEIDRIPVSEWRASGPVSCFYSKKKKIFPKLQRYGYYWTLVLFRKISLCLFIKYQNYFFESVKAMVYRFAVFQSSVMIKNEKVSFWICLWLHRCLIWRILSPFGCFDHDFNFNGVLEFEVIDLYLLDMVVSKIFQRSCVYLNPEDFIYQKKL